MTSGPQWLLQSSGHRSGNALDELHQLPGVVSEDPSPPMRPLRGTHQGRVILLEGPGGLSGPPPFLSLPPDSSSSSAACLGPKKYPQAGRGLEVF